MWFFTLEIVIGVDRTPFGAYQGQTHRTIVNAMEMNAYGAFDLAMPFSSRFCSSRKWIRDQQDTTLGHRRIRRHTLPVSCSPLYPTTAEQRRAIPLF